MISARYLLAFVCVAAIGCGESDRTPGEGSLESDVTADGDRVLPRSDKSTDPAVTLVGAAGTESTPANDGDTGEPDAGPVDTDSSNDEGPSAGAGSDNGNSGNGGQAGGAGSPMTEPEPPEGDAATDDNGGLVGTVCDLLGGLLCPVGLLCVEGLCQEPPAS